MVDRFGTWYPDYLGQQPYQDPAYVRFAGGNGQTSQQGPQQTQSMTPPTIRAEIVQIDDMAAIDRFPMGAGTSQIFMTKDEMNIVIRSMYANGQHNDDIYDKRPPAPPEPRLNPADYVRKDEIMDYIAKAVRREDEKE